MWVRIPPEPLIQKRIERDTMYIRFISAENRSTCDNCGKRPEFSKKLMIFEILSKVKFSLCEKCSWDVHTELSKELSTRD